MRCSRLAHKKKKKQAASGAALGGPDRVAAGGGSRGSFQGPHKIVIGCNNLAQKFQSAQEWMTDEWPSFQSAG